MLGILQQVTSGGLRIANSNVLEFEIYRITDQTRQNGIAHFLSHASLFQPLTEAIEQRASHLHGLGFKRLDAPHLVAAKSLKADAIHTTDDQLLCIASRHLNQLTIAVMNPVHFTTT